MAVLRVPKQYEAGLTQILSLSEESAQELVSALESTPITLYRKDILASATSKIKSISPDKVQEIIDVLIGLYVGRAETGISLQEFVEDASSSVERSGQVPLSDQNRKQFQQRLFTLLNINSLAVASKAIGVLFENEHNLTSARVVTDIRPVFGESTSSPPAAAIIVHMLKIHYLQNGQHKEFFVALDTKDVQKMITVLERAKSKAESLRSLVEAAKVPYLEPE